MGGWGAETRQVYNSCAREKYILKFAGGGGGGGGVSSITKGGGVCGGQEHDPGGVPAIACGKQGHNWGGGWGSLRETGPEK